MLVEQIAKIILLVTCVTCAAGMKVGIGFQVENFVIFLFKQNNLKFFYFCCSKCILQGLGLTEELLVALLSILHKRHGKCRFNAAPIFAADQSSLKRGF